MRENPAWQAGDPAAAPVLGADLEFLRLVWAVVHALEQTSKRMERTLGITAPQRFVIRMLGRFPGLTLARLAALLQLHASTVSGIVKRLERRGLVSHRADTRDRRRAYLGLTAAGRLLDVECAGTVESAVHGVLARLAPVSIEGARETLAALASAMRPPTPGARRVARVRRS